MKIYKYNIPNELILRYCKIITLMEEKFDTQLEDRRKEVHDEIFDFVGCHRSLYRRQDREFNTALNKVVRDIIYEKDQGE